MRVIGGSARGRRLLAVPGSGTRPIVDRLKTSLFDILRPRISGLEVLDAFAGTGGVGIEALSQGAASCTFLDLSGKAIATIRKNLEITEVADRSDVRKEDALAYLGRSEKAFDLIYVAPPQYKRLWVKALQQIAARPELLRGAFDDALDDDSWPALVVVQIDPREYEVLALGALRESRQERYGNSMLLFYEWTREPAPPIEP